MNDIKEKLLNDPFVFQKIQERAYFIAESNGFAPGRDADNWFAAEAEVLTPFLAEEATNEATNGATNGAAKVAKTTTRKAAPKKAALNSTTTEAPLEAPVAPVTRAKRASKKSA